MNETLKYPKRLIEVDLPIKKISENSRNEKNIKKGNISSLHIWWARRPLGACRAVILAALWPDPVDENCPNIFRSSAIKLLKELRDRRGGAKKDLDNPLELRKALLDFIAEFSSWDNSFNKDFINTSRNLTQVAHESMGGVPGTRPLVVDPFAGGGSIPIEALRIGADAFASDLNPLPIMLNKVVLEYLPKFGIELTEQFRRSANSIRERLESQLRRFYFKNNENGNPQVFFWARTIICEGPACGFKFPLLRSLWLCQKKKKGVGYLLKKNSKNKEFDVQIINVNSNSEIKSGTSNQGAATCPACGYTTPVEHVRTQLSERRGGAVDAKFLAVALTKSGVTGKVYRTPTPDEIIQFNKGKEEYLKELSKTENNLTSIPNEELNHLRGFFNVVLYGMTSWGDIFSPRQALLMTSITKLINEEFKNLSSVNVGLAEAVATCLALAAGKVAQYNSNCCRWKPTGETLVDMFGRQAIPMVWDFAEAYPFSGSTGDFSQYIESISAVLDNFSILVQNSGSGTVRQSSATTHPLPNDIADAFVTDPPYYDAIPYADLSDFFYVWFRRMLFEVHPQLFIQPLSPKTDECVTLAHRAAMYRNKDRKFFEQMMTVATSEARRYTKPGGIGIVVFANKSTSGWEAMLTALIDSGWVVTASWPIDTEMSSRLRAQDSAVLASSVHLVCRPREKDDGSIKTAEIGDWRDVLEELPIRIHEWMPRLAEEGVVGADAIFACLGPALEIFSKFSHVEKASGQNVALKEYLEHVWAAVSKEALAQIFKDVDATGFEEDARLTAMWLWTVSAQNGGSIDMQNGEESEDDEEQGPVKGSKSGFVLEYDAARKISQGLGAHLEDLNNLIEIKGDVARLLPVSERTRHLFGKDQTGNNQKRTKKKDSQVKMDFIKELEVAEETGEWGPKDILNEGKTVLDRVHQVMILFGAGRSEALKRVLVDEGVGKDDRFWKLANALSALYPTGTDEKRWVDGVLARKKGLGL